MTEEDVKQNPVMPWMTEEEIKSGHVVPWKRIGSYLHEHRRTATLVEVIIYASLCFTLYHVGKEV